MKALGEHIADHVLREQIAGYLGGIEKGFQTFRENSDERYIYALKVRQEGGSWDGEYLASGYFFDWETALACGKKEKAPFERGDIVKCKRVDGREVFGIVEEERDNGSIDTLLLCARDIY